jgi:hypothetical protein
MCISFVYFSCKQSGTKHIIDITPENNDSREERHLREAMLDRTRKLNLPILQVDSDKLEIRIWVSDFLKGESVLDIKIEGEKVNIWQTHIWESFPEVRFRNKDTSNYFLQVQVDSSSMKSIALKIDPDAFADTLKKVYINDFPTKTDFTAISEATSDGSGLLFEILNKGDYQYLVYRCFQTQTADRKAHMHIKSMLAFIRQNTNAFITSCN